MKIQTKVIATLVGITISFFILNACKKHENLMESRGMAENITNSVRGRITDINNEPINKAVVSDGQATTTTDINGEFTLKNIQTHDGRAFITAIKADYFNGSRVFFCNGNSINNVLIKLIPKVASGNFASSTGGSINVWGGGVVFIGAGSVVKATSGSAYKGNVSVSTFYLNPTDHRFNEYMPGELLGITINNEERLLQSFGMLSIEMNDENGEKLQLAPGKSASISLPIPPNLQTMAPENIPLWYFDEQKGIWKEEGLAIKKGSAYTGTVTHFSFWNCDLPAKYVKLTATFNKQKGVPLINYLVSVTSAIYGTRKCYTDNQGSVSGLIPANETLILSLYDQCNQIIYTTNIGPFSADIDLGTITVTQSGTQTYITVSGNVVTCNNVAVTNGYIQVHNGGNYFSAPLIDGNFTITFPVCPWINTPVTLVAIDKSNSLQSELQVINGTNGNQDIGQITACTDLR